MSQREVFAHVTGRELRIEYVNTALDMTTQVKYDRLYDRVFDNSKIKSLVPEFKPVSVREGLTRCLSEFVRDKHPFRGLDVLWEVRMDRMTGSHSFLCEGFSRRDRVRYLVWRYCPALGVVLRAAKKLLHAVRTIR